MNAPIIKKAVLPLAGWGTRFLPLTKILPKEALPLLNKPMIHWLVDECVSSGITEIIFVTRPEKQLLLDYFARDQALESFLAASHKTDWLEKISALLPSNVKIHVLYQKEQKGLGHAFLQAQPLISPGEYFAGLLPDEVFFSARKSALAQMISSFQQKPHTVIGLMQVPQTETVHYGIADLEKPLQSGGLSRIRGFVEKPSPEKAPSTWSLPGRYIFHSSLFDALRTQAPGPAGEIQLTDALTKMCSATEVWGCALDALRFDTGRLDGFVQANLFAYLFLEKKMSKEKAQKYLETFLKETAPWQSL